MNADCGINEGRLLDMKKMCWMGCEVAMLHQRKMHLGQVDLSCWVQARQWQDIHRNSIILLCPSSPLGKKKCIRLP